MRPMIAAAAFLGVAALTACDSGEPPILDPTLNTGTGTPSPIAASTGAPGRWQKIAGECPPIPAAGAALRPGKPVRGAIDNSFVLNVQCSYAAAKGDSPALDLTVGIYRVGILKSSADDMAADNLAKNRRDADTSARLPTVVTTVSGVGDAGFASLIPGKGVRLYARSSNVVVLVEYADPGDSKRSLAAAQAYANDVLAALQ